MYHQQTIDVAADTGVQSVSAQVAENGLAYHRTLSVVRIDYWTVTHVASGHAVTATAMYFENAQQCEAFIDKIGGLVDWTKAKPRASKNVQAQLTRIASEIRSHTITYL